jgi:starch phosphorylase
MQEYFFVSAGLQSIVRHYKKKYHESIYKFDQYVAIHINDTHPALVIPELMRILMDEEGLSWDAAWNITVRTVAYTNHTILPEAMERWSIPMFKELLPRIYLIVEEINRRWLKEVRKLYPARRQGPRRGRPLGRPGPHGPSGRPRQPQCQRRRRNPLPDPERLDAAPVLYVFPASRFSNKTNGVSHRRWLIQSNPQLAAARRHHRAGLAAGTETPQDSWKNFPTTRPSSNGWPR